MKLIVGLGNPGNEYKNTRHNIGFMLVDYLFKRDFVVNKKFNALECIEEINNEKIIIIKPLTFMNLSGESVIKYVNYYKINLDDILIIQDDMDMGIGKIKLLYNHGDGGHNGIKNIITNLGSKSFLRLKIGISSPGNRNVVDYVLGKFSVFELKKLNESFELLEDLITDYVFLNRELLIGKYNSKLLGE